MLPAQRFAFYGEKNKKHFYDGYGKGETIVIFGFSEEQSAFRDNIRKFTQKEIAPLATVIDREHRFPVETIKKFGKLGYMGFPFPEEYGGLGLNTTYKAIFIEEVAKACASTAVIMLVHLGAGCSPVYLYGTEELRQKYLVPSCDGRYLAAFALTEPDCGSDNANLRCAAVRRGENYIINGEKIFITNGGYADYYVTMVRTNPEIKGYKGISALIVDKETPGLKVGKPIEKMGLHGSATVPLSFEDCAVPVANRLLAEGNGLNVALGVLNGGRVVVGAQGVGIAQGCLEHTIAYIKERRQFGRSIASNQGVQWMISEMVTQIEAARLLVYKAAWCEDVNHPEAMVAASMAKWFGTDAAMKVTTECVQLFGGYGYCKEYPVERYMRDAKATQIYEGTNEIQKMVISRKVLDLKSGKA